MKVQHATDWIEEAESLRRRLAQSAFVSRLDGDEHEEAGAIAYGLGDIAESCQEILDQRLPALRRPGISDEEIEELLIEIREDLRHILYHLSESRFFALVMLAEMSE
jgi:hypothetical protein